MSDEKLDLILNVVSEIKLKVDNLDTKVERLETRFDGLETRFDGLETRFDGLETKVDNLDSEFRSFKHQVSESFTSVNNRFTLLEKQMVAIGLELKAEIKQEIRSVGVKIERLEKQVIHDRNETLEIKGAIRELEDRMTKVENHISI